MVVAASKVGGPELQPDLAQTPPATPPPVPNRIRCALVMGSRAARAALAGLAERSSHALDLVDAGSISEAWLLLDGGNFDLVLLDPNLPDGDGLTLAAELSGDVAYSGLPVIIVTRDSTSEQIVRAMRSGATDYLVSDGLTVNGLDHAVAEATGPRGAAAVAARTRIADLRHEIIGLRRTALRNMRLLKFHAVPLLAFAWKMTAGVPVDDADQPALARRLARLTRSLTGLIDDTAILAATRHGRERPTPVDPNHLVGDLVAGDVADLRSSCAHVRCSGLPTLLARRSHMAMLFEELLANAVRAARLGVAPEIELGAGVDADGNPIIWMTENGLPLSARKQALGVQMTSLVEPDENAGLDPHAWSLCQRLAEKNRGEFRIVEDGDQGFKVMIRFAREMLV